MNVIYRALLLEQIDRDTLWCLPCGMMDIRRPADVVYTVSSEPQLATVRACRECLMRELVNGVPIIASQPITQPAYIDLLKRALASVSQEELGIALGGIRANLHGPSHGS